MANLPPVPWPDLATKSDVAHLGEALRGEMGQIGGEMGELRAELAAVLTHLSTLWTWR